MHDLTKYLQPWHFFVMQKRDLNTFKRQRADVDRIFVVYLMYNQGTNWKQFRDNNSLILRLHHQKTADVGVSDNECCLRF